MLFKPVRNFLLILAAVVLAGAGFVEAAFLRSGLNPVEFAKIRMETGSIVNQTPVKIILPPVENSPKILQAIEDQKRKAEESSQNSQSQSPSSEIKKKVAAVPPVSSGLTTATTDNGDGTQTTVISEGSASQAEFNRIAAMPDTPDTPYAVTFKDETGRYASLATPLKEYLNSTLRWSDEISSLRTIIVKAAGTTGWSGQYNGSYTMTGSGDITDAFGWITLNSSAYDDYKSQQPGALGAEDFFKYVLAHEYGHHYTLYHKWVEADLPAASRFPDSYYTVRSLSKDKTTVDCSTSWNTCDSEIIAEDYSYIYSGYGYHAMKSTFGLPSTKTKTWLDNISESLKAGLAIAAPSSAAEAPPPAPNLPPSLEIISPVSGTALSTSFTFAVSASDDKAVQKIVFSRDETVLLEDASSPYEVEINLNGLAAGSYRFKAKAYDNDGATAERSFVLSLTQSTAPPAASGHPVSSGATPPVLTNPADLSDTEKPAVVFLKPGSNPSEWASGNLAIRVQASDNVAVIKIELYINDSLVAMEDDGLLSRSWSYDNAGAGEYTLKTKVYDAAGNIGEATLVVNKR